MGGKSVGMGREWMRKGRKSSWEGEQWILASLRRLSTGSGFRMLKVSFWLVLYFCLMEEGEEKGRNRKRRRKTITVG
jgi:hypothetical protein